MTTPRSGAHARTLRLPPHRGASSPARAAPASDRPGDGGATGEFAEATVGEVDAAVAAARQAHNAWWALSALERHGAARGRAAPGGNQRRRSASA